MDEKFLSPTTPLTVFITYPTLIRFVDLIAELPADQTAEFAASIFEAGLDAKGAPPTLEQIARELPLERNAISDEDGDDEDEDEDEDCGDRYCAICFERRRERARL
jgi:hypothetical protein